MEKEEKHVSLTISKEMDEAITEYCRRKGQKKEWVYREIFERGMEDLGIKR
jgi:predicted DNA-binding protein